MSLPSDEMYATLSHTASSFIQSCAPSPPNSNHPNKEAILSHFSPDFRMSWGHAFSLQSMPNLQGKKTGEEFVEHMTGMAEKLETWRPEVRDTMVDVREMRVMVRAEFEMVVQGGKAWGNDIVFLMRMDKEGTKLVEYVEFIDPIVGMEIAKALKEADMPEKSRN